ncbi:MAG: hypothetical protein AB7U73_12950 [Pirellulales bacterium]
MPWQKASDANTTPVILLADFGREPDCLCATRHLPGDCGWRVHSSSRTAGWWLRCDFQPIGISVSSTLDFAANFVMTVSYESGFLIQIPEPGGIVLLWLGLPAALDMALHLGRANSRHVQFNRRF